MYTNIEYLKKHAGVIETAKALGYSTVGYQLGKYMRDREQKEEFLNNILNQINAQTKHASLQEDTMVKKAGVVSTIRNLGYGTVGYYLGKKVQDNDQKEALIENLKRQIEAQNKYASLNINQHNNTNSIVKKAMMEKQAVNFGNLFSAFKLFNKSNKLNPLMNKGFSINSKGQLSKPGIFSNIINRFTKSNGNQTITQVKPTITPEKAIGAQSLVKNRAPWIKGSTKDKNTSLLQKKLKGITPEEAAETSLSDTYNSMKKWVKENPGKTLMGAGALGGLGIASLNSGGADNYYNNVDRYYYNGFNPNYNQYNNQR